MSDLLREVGRKTFHMLSLAYLAAYLLLGYPRVITWMVPWTALVLALETARLYSEALNNFLFKLLGALAREEERRRYSGIVYTTLGSFFLFLAFGEHRALVEAGLLCLALGDAAAALVGKSIGRHRFFGSKKSAEGSLACLVVCAGACAWAGFPVGCALAAAIAGTVVEWLPTGAFFNDNLWMPIAVALSLRLCAAS